MIGLDTNVMVRYLVQDHPEQSAQATRLIETELSPDCPGFVSLVCLVEIVWVLERCYDQSKAQLLDVIERMLEVRQLVVERPDQVVLARHRFSEGVAGFSDALILTLAEEAGCETTYSFDKKAIRSGMSDLPAL